MDLKFKKDITALLVFLIFWIALFLYSGTFTSGYHFIDDHEIISLNSKLNHSPFLYTAKNYILFDFNWRFRPL